MENKIAGYVFSTPSQFIDLNQRKNRMHGYLRHSLRQGEAIGSD